MRRMAWLVVFLLVPVPAVAEMPRDENINAVAESWLARKPAVRKRFNYDKPIRGTLFAKMILTGPARVPAVYRVPDGPWLRGKPHGLQIPY